jgi:L-threonylcarbamoyladenylate synthase
MLLTSRHVEPSPHTIHMPANPTDYAHELYASLRRLDALNLPALYIEMPPDEPQWSAIRDRLIRATRPLPQ